MLSRTGSALFLIVAISQMKKTLSVLTFSILTQGLQLNINQCVDIIMNCSEEMFSIGQTLNNIFREIWSSHCVLSYSHFQFTLILLCICQHIMLTLLCMSHPVPQGNQSINLLTLYFLGHSPLFPVRPIRSSVT